MADLIEEWREKLIETAVEQDDDAMGNIWKAIEPDMDTINVASVKAL